MVRGIKGTDKACGCCKDEGYRHRYGSCGDWVGELGVVRWTKGTGKGIHLKVKCQGRFKVKYQGQGHMKVKYSIFSILSTNA